LSEEFNINTKEKRENELNEEKDSKNGNNLSLEGIGQSKMYSDGQEEKNKINNKEIQDLEDEISQNRRTIQEHQRKIKDYEEENIDHQEKLKILQKKNQSKKEKIISLKKELEVVKNQCKRLKEELGEYENYEEIKTELDEKTSRVSILEKNNRNLKDQIIMITQDNENHLDTITNLKIEIKKLKDKLKAKKGKTQEDSEEIIELKKELKILRRERDHYKDIVKKNNLL
jgi:chromosome segregation ATPase